jgi:hypothetical protein
MAFPTTGVGIFLVCASIVCLGSSTDPYWKKEKLDQRGFGLRVLLPSLLGLICYLIGTYLLFSSMGAAADDEFFTYVIPITAGGGILVSTVAIINSYSVMLWGAN